MSSGAILAVPACEQGRGGGHLVRCMALVSGLRALGREAWLFAHTIIDAADFNRDWLITAESGLADTNWECILLDRFQTPPEEFARWTKLAPVIGIDEGGPERSDFDFLMDILPNCSRISPNITDPSLLLNKEAGVRNEECEDKEAQRIKILVSFGHEDAAGLGIATAKALTEQNNNAIEVTLLQGGLSPFPISHSLPPIPHSSLLTPNSLSIPNSSLLTPHSLPPIPNSSFLIPNSPPIPKLSEHLHEYDLIITHFGLTAFESLYAGVPVLLVSPGAYHEKLAQKAGFYSLGVGKKAAQQLPRLLFKKNELNRAFINKLENIRAALTKKYNLDKAPQQSLAEFINNVKLNVSRNCPACGDVRAEPMRNQVLARFSERTYRRCKCCGIISMNRLSPPPIEYGKEYFFELYQKQYGKTYIEDFPHLVAMGKRRLAVIKSLLPENSAIKGNAPPLLDIGCAYGPFLQAAREEGFSPYGIDPAEDAVRYVTQTLNIPAIQGFFPDLGNGDWGSGIGQYNVITLWYVIEHFRDCVPVLSEIRKLLKPGGILAFATPSFSGISGRSSLNYFLERSPADHWTIWSPAMCRKALKAAGFTVKKIVCGGHHPERFPLLGKFARSKKSPLYWPLLAASRIFALGDTFEVYAVKNGE